MATEAQKVAFIKEIAPCAQYAYKNVGKVLPSVCIAMACVESAYGTSNLMRKNHAFLGQKCGSGRTATKYWDKTFFTSKTKEEYTVGVHTVITDAFRSYRNMQQCVLNYYELLNTRLYSKVKAGADYETQMKQIKACGYMTSSTEVNSVITLIRRYNLTQYDTVLADNVSLGNELYTIGKMYKLQANMYIRKEPNGEKIGLYDTCITQNARKNAFADDEGFAVIKKGTRVTCKEIKENGAIWMRIPSGWICARSVSGKMFIA